MSNQILIASTMIGVVESLLYAERAKLDLSDVIELKLSQRSCGMLDPFEPWTTNAQ